MRVVTQTTLLIKYSTMLLYVCSTHSDKLTLVLWQWHTRISSLTSNLTNAFRFTGGVFIYRAKTSVKIVVVIDATICRLGLYRHNHGVI